MFLLTEGTLFFLDLALNARACDEKPSPSSVVQKWVYEVAAANDVEVSAGDAHTTTGASSTLFASPPAYPSCPDGDCGVASQSMLQDTPVFSKMFSTDAEKTGETEKSRFNDVSIRTTNMTSLHDSDKGRCHSDPSTSLSFSVCFSTPTDEVRSRRQPEMGGVKRKIGDVDIISGIESDGNGGDDMDLGDSIPAEASLSAKMTSVGVRVKSPTLPPQKRARREDMSSPLHQAPPLGYIYTAARMELPQELRRRLVDNDGCTMEVIKKSSEYTTRDLPVPCDQRWSQSFISTAILWYSVQQNIWDVPRAELASALQCIFNTVYPNVNYRVTPEGSVFALTMQRILEWQNSFGSSALAMMLHFFSTLDNVDDVHTSAEFLATDFRFLRADPDTCDPTEPFRSPFLLILLAITHLGDIAACVDVPGWDTRAMAAGEGGEGVVAIASAALERAMTFFRDGTLDVDHVLAETARSPDALLPRNVLDAFAGNDAPPALRFSSANWSGHTAAYRDAVRKRGAAFVRGTFEAAWAKRRRIVGAGAGDEEDEGDVESDVGVSAVPDPRALL